MDKNNLLEKAKKFKIPGEPIDVILLESGHINKTYKVIYNDEESEKEYILQYVNTNVFPNLPELMTNIKKVTKYIKEKAKENNENLDKITITIMDTLDNNEYSIHDSNWRMENFITNTITYLTTEDLDVLYEAGKAAGSFQKYLDGFEAEKLYEIIPKFHHTPNRLNQLREALNSEENKEKRNDRFELAKESLEVLLDEVRINKTNTITNGLETKKIPYRVTHNDTKLSNILFDNDTNKSVCLIDLDTVMPGALAYDFGEGIRTGITLAKEDEADLNKIKIDLNRFEAFAKGFLENVKSIMTKEEQNTLVLGAWMMTYENAIRFMADYLNGDTYFHVDKKIANHNLIRAKAQIEILKQMEEEYDKMEGMIKKYGL